MPTRARKGVANFPSAHADSKRRSLSRSLPQTPFRNCSGTPWPSAEGLGRADCLGRHHLATTHAQEPQSRTRHVDVTGKAPGSRFCRHLTQGDMCFRSGNKEEIRGRANKVCPRSREQTDHASWGQAADPCVSKVQWPQVSHGTTGLENFGVLWLTSGTSGRTRILSGLTTHFLVNGKWPQL